MNCTRVRVAEGDRRVGQVMPVDRRWVRFADARGHLCFSLALVNCFAERTPTFVVMYVICTIRVTGDGCSMQHANALLLCCIAQRPDIEAETRVVVRGQDADELILCYICVSHQHTCM